MCVCVCVQFLLFHVLNSQFLLNFYSGKAFASSMKHLSSSNDGNNIKYSIIFLCCIFHQGKTKRQLLFQNVCFSSPNWTELDRIVLYTHLNVKTHILNDIQFTQLPVQPIFKSLLNRIISFLSLLLLYSLAKYDFWLTYIHSLQAPNMYKKFSNMLTKWLWN